MPSRFPPRWLNFIGLPPSGLGKDPPGTEFYYLGMPARWLKPGEIIDVFDGYVRRVLRPDSTEPEDQYLNVMPSWVGSKAGETACPTRIFRFLYHT